MSAYQAYPAPTRSAIFDAGTVSRINVAHFISQAVLHPSLWQRWQGQAPVLYSQE